MLDRWRMALWWFATGLFAIILWSFMVAVGIIIWERVLPWLR